MRELKSNKAIKEIFPGAETSGSETSSAETAALNGTLPPLKGPNFQFCEQGTGKL